MTSYHALIKLTRLVIPKGEKIDDSLLNGIIINSLDDIDSNDRALTDFMVYEIDSVISPFNDAYFVGYFENNSLDMMLDIDDYIDIMDYLKQCKVDYDCDLDTLLIEFKVSSGNHDNVDIWYSGCYSYLEGTH